MLLVHVCNRVYYSGLKVVARLVYFIDKVQYFRTF